MNGGGVRYSRSALVIGMAIALACLISALLQPTVLQAVPNALLSGSVRSAGGEKLAGVTVSAKADGQPITTSVFTDEDGNYYFPVMESGKYRVWAQATSF